MTSGEPHWSAGSDPAVLFSRYLDFYRDKAIEKVHALSAEQRTVSRVPSLWTPLQLLHHLAHMEQRWFVWGFLAQPVAEPFGDEADGVWVLPADRSLDDVEAMLREVGERTRAVLASHPLDTVAGVGGRFDSDPPTLSWICFHVLQEYARHVGHLDVVVELAGGRTGE
jgi:uncharacterized damage-inducible protein DinB